MSSDGGVFHQARYLDVVLRALDEIVGAGTTDDRQVQRYQSVRRTLARFAVDRSNEPGRDELGVTLPHARAASLTDAALRVAVRQETDLLDGAIGRADARLGVTGAAGGSAPIAAPDIEKALRRAGHPDAVVHSAQLVIGGRSKETVLLAVDGVAGVPHDCVLRRDIALSSLGTTVTDEFPLLQVLHRFGVQVPEPYLLVADADLLLTPFMLVERRAGSAGGGIIGTTTTPARVHATARALASVHLVPVGEIQAAMGGRPAATAVSLKSELDDLYAEWQRLNRGDSVIVEAAYRWLRANVPADSARRTLVHADFSFHNLLFVADELTAILDWELAHVGDPAEDLCYLRPTAQAVVGWDAFMATYRDAGGSDIALPGVQFYGLRATFRLIVQLLRSRDHFEHGRVDDPLKADGSMYWLPRIAQRLARELQDVLPD